MDRLIAYLKEPTRERFENFVKTHSAFVWNIAYRLTRHAEDAADVCQEVFLGLIVRPPPWSSIRSAKGFLAVCQATSRALSYTDRSGSYRIADLEAGTYQLEVLSIGYAKKVIEEVQVRHHRKILQVAAADWERVPGG